MTAVKKLVVVGDPQCGKTSLVNVYLRKTLPTPDSLSNPELHGEKLVSVAGASDEVQFSVRTTTGIEEYELLRKLLYREVDVILLCFSIGSKESLENVRAKWLPEIKSLCSKAVIVHVGNKVDLRWDLDQTDINRTFVTFEEGELLKETANALQYIECSALYNFLITDVFRAARKAVTPMRRDGCTLL